MSNKKLFLALKLEGPLQAWGHSSKFENRNTGLFPTKSAIAGICCAAFGFSRGSDEEKKFLERFNQLKMTAIRLAKPDPRWKDARLDIRILEDFHTVKDTLTANRKDTKTAITYRYYLNDASFGVLLKGQESFLKEIEKALIDPRWVLFLGRKSCVPTAPICRGLYSDYQTALAKLGVSSGQYYSMRDVESYSEGEDSFNDTPLCFHSVKRQFVLRRVKYEMISI